MLRSKRVLPHPGEILAEEFLKPLNLSAHALALALRVPANRITGIVNGSRSVSADTALRLARYFGTTPEFWIQMRLLAIQTEITAMRIDITTIIDSQPALFQAVMRLERDMVRVKDLLGHMDDRIARLERTTK